MEIEDPTLVRQANNVPKLYTQSTPAGMCTDKSDILFVTFPDSNSIQAFDPPNPSYEPDAEFEEIGEFKFEGQDDTPGNCCIQAGTNRLVVHFPEQSVIRSFAWRARKGKLTLEPMLEIHCAASACIATDAKGGILNADEDVTGAQLRSEQGQLVREFAKKGSAKMDMPMWLTVPPINAVVSPFFVLAGRKKEGEPASDVLQFWTGDAQQCFKEVPWKDNLRWKMCFDQNGFLTVCCSEFQKRSVEIFVDLNNVKEPTQTILQMSSPQNLCVDSNNNLYVGNVECIQCHPMPLP